MKDLGSQLGAQDFHGFVDLVVQRLESVAGDFGRQLGQLGGLGNQVFEAFLREGQVVRVGDTAFRVDLVKSAKFWFSASTPLAKMLLDLTKASYCFFCRAVIWSNWEKASLVAFSIVLVVVVMTCSMV